MSTQVIAPTTSGTFLYDGCYRARGELSFAQREAWGLYRHIGAGLPGPSASSSREAYGIAQRSPVIARQKAPGTGSLAIHMHRSSGRERRTWKIFGGAHVTRGVVKKAFHNSAARSKSLRWRRYRIRVLDSTITLLVVNGSRFAASAGSRRP